MAAATPVPLTVSFPIAETVIHITQHTTVHEATEMVLRELGIQRGSGFGLIGGILEGAEVIHFVVFVGVADPCTAKIHLVDCVGVAYPCIA